MEQVYSVLVIWTEKEADDLSYDIYGRYKNQLIYQEKIGKSYKLRVMDLETKKITQPLENLEHAVKLFWASDIKIMTYYDNSSGEPHYETYQYSESGETVLVREGGEDSYLAPIVAAGDLLVCNYGSDWDEARDFDLASISKEDFLAGKNNWTVLEY
ncbi:MAG: hypothetical protein HFI66_08915 [Lachnospiraceae bacterium]|jgi:hypothetical protein|nr:hypothetical protein [Lachnospiraceae bacterium]